MINFFSEDTDFEFDRDDTVSQWVTKVAGSYGFDIGEINYIFCSDEYLYEINVEHLDHHTYTDIITFPLSEEGEDLISDMFISIDRVRENALDQGVSFEEELDRVMIHGMLHLCGLKDKDETAALEMRAAEDKALSLR